MGNKEILEENHVKIFHCAKDPTYTYKILTVQLKKTIRAIKLPLKTESVTAMLYVAAGSASCYSWPVSASFQGLNQASNHIVYYSKV